MTEYIERLKNNSKLSDAEKILRVYQAICLEKSYDSNYYFSLGYENVIAPSDEWKVNRLKHNRMICHEIAQLIAKSVDMLELEDTESFVTLNDGHAKAYVFNGDKVVELEPTNGFGITKCNDLVKAKLGLPLEGISIKLDKDGEFEMAQNVINYKSDVSSHSKEYVKKLINCHAGNDVFKEDPESYLRTLIELLKKDRLEDSDFYSVMLFSAKVAFGIKSDQTRTFGKLMDDKSRFYEILTFKVGEKFYVIDSHTKEMKVLNKELERKKYAMPFIQKHDIGYVGKSVHIPKIEGDPRWIRSI